MLAPSPLTLPCIRMGPSLSPPGEGIRPPCQTPAAMTSCPGAEANGMAATEAIRVSEGPRLGLAVAPLLTLALFI
jgi:hypothetical protein